VLALPRLPGLPPGPRRFPLPLRQRLREEGQKQAELRGFAQAAVKSYKRVLLLEKCESN